jgi:hypothetical protein
LPDSLTDIETQAFFSCDNLVALALPPNLARIERGAFIACGSLATMRIPASVTSLSGPLFENCHSLTNIAVEPANAFYSSLDGVLFDKAQTTLMEYPRGRSGGYTVPETVTAIARASCYNTDGLTSLTIGGGVTSLGEYAFQRCDSLETVTIGSGLTALGRSVFADCPLLQGVYIGSDAPAVHDEPVLFANATNVTVYYLPDTSGWTGVFGERPTAPWLPRVQTDRATFGMFGEAFGFNVIWASGRLVAIDGTTKLTNPAAWTQVGAVLLEGGSGRFIDLNSSSRTTRIYRLRAPE